MSYSEVEVQSGDKHVSFQSNFVHAGWRQSYGQWNGAQQRRRTFSIVRKRILWSQSAYQQHHLCRVRKKNLWVLRSKKKPKSTEPLFALIMIIYVGIEMTICFENKIQLFGEATF